MKAGEDEQMGEKVDQNGDYIFRYKFDLPPDEVCPPRNALNEMLRNQLKNILDIIVPCVDGKEVKIDGFKLLSDRNTVYGLNNGLGKKDGGSVPCRNTKNAALYEPRIDFIRRQLESLLSVVELEKSGELVKVEGFRLKNLADWVGSSQCDPVEVFEHAATRCNCNCVFCYNKGTPPSLALVNSKRKAEEELLELKTRVKYFSPKAYLSLFPSIGSSCEVLAHPHIVEILSLLREKTGKPFRIVTNGASLTPDLISELSQLKPLYLDLSLNSATPSRRRFLMQDRAPEIAIGALPLLCRENIPYAVGVVPWPLGSFAEMLDDLGRTVGYADEHGAHLIQVSLPGYTRYFASEKVFDRDHLWGAVVGRVRELRGKYRSPIVAMPSMFEENIYERRKNLPGVTGVVKNSPAFFAGIENGDLILQINGINIRNRPQAREVLSVIHQSDAGMASITVQRSGRKVETTLDLAKYFYPYARETSTHLGIIFMGTGLRVGYLERLKEIIQDRRAKKVLFLSSALVKPTLEQCLAGANFFGDGEIKVVVPENRFFGGNIFMGDLLVVQDFIDCIEEYVAKKRSRPDLVVIPSSPFNLSQWGRDLTGRVYLDIERSTGIPVELLECATIYD